MMKKKILFTLLSFCLFFPLLNAEHSEIFLKKISALNPKVKPGKQYLVLIALDKYENRMPLKLHVENAKKLKSILREKYYTDEVIELYDYSATYSSIIGTLSKLQRELKKDDSLIFFFSGHGFIDKKESYWIPYDAGINEASKENWISGTNFIASISKIKASNILVLSDSCFLDKKAAMSKKEPKDFNIDYFRSSYSKVAVQVLGSGIKQTGMGESDFIKGLLNELQRNRKSYISPLEIYRNIEYSVKDYPLIFGNLKGTSYMDGGNFVLVRREKDPLKVAKLEIVDKKDKKNKEKEIKNKREIKIKEKKQKEKIEKKDIFKKEKKTEKEKISDVPKEGYIKISSMVNTTGKVFCPIGAIFATSGSFLFIYDILYWFDKVSEYIEKDDNNTPYVQYETAYNTNIALFSTSVSLMAVGTILFIASFPMMFYKNKQKRMSLNLSFGEDINIGFSYLF